MTKKKTTAKKVVAAKKATKSEPVKPVVPETSDCVASTPQALADPGPSEYHKGWQSGYADARNEITKRDETDPFKQFQLADKQIVDIDAHLARLSEEVNRLHKRRADIYAIREGCRTRLLHKLNAGCCGSVGSSSRS